MEDQFDKEWLDFWNTLPSGKLNKKNMYSFARLKDKTWVKVKFSTKTREIIKVYQ